MQNVHPPYRHCPEAAWVPIRPRRPPPAPLPFRIKELATVLGLAALVDLVAYGPEGVGAGGYGLALFFSLVPIGMVVAARRLRVTPRSIVVGAALFVAALRCAWSPTPGTILGGLALLLAFGLVLRTRRMFVPEAFASSLSAIAKLPSRLGAVFAGTKSLVARTRLGKMSVLPIVVPVALTALFAGVFALANPVVAHGLGVVGETLARIVGVPAPARIALFVFSMVGAAALLRPAIVRPRSIEAATAIGDASPVAIGIARNALVMLNVVFFAYDALDAAYLWSGSPPAGMRTQQYAHEGAFWTTIALVMLTVVVGVMFKGALAHDERPHAKLARRLAFVWCAQGAVLAAGTYRRIAIHIAKSGLSDLRIVGILGTTLVATGVALVAWKLYRQRTFIWLLRRQLDAFALTVFFYAVFPTHLVSAHVNVARVQAGEYRPAMHMFRQAQSEESAAAVLPLLDHSDVRIRQGVAALLEDERLKLHAQAPARWRLRSYAEGRTLRALDEAAPRIATALAGADPHAARRSLYEVTRVANEDRSLEEILAVPSASDVNADSSTRNVY